MRNIVAQDYANVDLKIIWDGAAVAEFRPPPVID